MPNQFLSIEFPTTIERTIERQLAFALVLTYTRCAQAAQAAVRSKLPQQFTLRNNFVSQGIKVDPATKADPEAFVYLPTDGQYSLDFMIIQETGGTKFPRVGKHLAIPMSVKRKRGRRGAIEGIIDEANRPKQLLATRDYKGARGRLNRVFLIDENTPERQRHGLFPGVYASNPRRKGKHRAGIGEGLTMLYMLVPDADVDQRFDFLDTCEATVKAQGQGIFSDALTQAVRTAR